MLKILPIIIISSTIPLSEPKSFILDEDYSEEVISIMKQDAITNSQDTSNILYDLILQELLENDS